MEAKENGAMMTERYFKWENIRSFLMKSILVSLIISPIHLSGLTFNTIAWPFILLVSLGCLFVFVFHCINGKGYVFNYVIFALPPIFLVSFIFRVPLLVVLFAALFLFFILKKELENNIHDEIVDGEGVLIFTVLSALMIWIVAAIFSLPFLYWVLLLVLLQFLIFSTGTFIGRYFEIGHEKGKKLIFITFFVGTSGMLIGAFFIVYVFSHYVRQLLDQILSIFAKLLMFISEPIIGLFTKSILNQEVEHKNISPGETHGKLDADIVLKLESTKAFNNIAIAIILIILSIVAIYAFKKLKNRRPQLVDSHIPTNPFYTNAAPLKNVTTIRPLYSEIDNDIRREIKSLEKFAAKKNLGRYPYESFREWFDRIGIQVSNNSINIYEGVRYGSLHATNDEIKNFMAEINNVKENLQNIYKNWKE
ncbi:hypothetical protein KHA96_06350 [Bacillus sp. FJAT-49711]|uniref:hypothetical protein n=1 Tax=Bacillus sp. FJAT-49711 TaxID=2833585 RepID=UPI001BC8CF31|nr:hypothetical protein [Bacillus sp. FJAT-49711]MBS4217942.1 hypothetical protein [Bacillus sp. FJAT-49711]